MLLLRLREIRTRLGYDRGTAPVISAVYTQADGSIHVVTSDRAEKSLLLGPGGRIAAELSGSMGKPLSVYSEDELLVRRHRLSLTKRRAEELSDTLGSNQDAILRWVLAMVEVESQYPEKEVLVPGVDDTSANAALAFSGGVDSTATLVILKEGSVHQAVLTVDLGETCISEEERRRISSNCMKLGVDHRFIPLAAETSTIHEKADGRRHPCNRCHGLMYQSLLDYVNERGIDVVVTGEMLPSGRQSLVMKGNVLVVHLPAALSLTKYRTQAIVKMNGLESGSDSFGCEQVRSVHAFGWRMMAPSVFRVLRELDAGVLSTGQALAQVKSIMRPTRRGKHGCSHLGAE